MEKGEINLKDRIKKIRKELHLTQKEFASKIGSSQNVLANYETGRRNPSASVINNICKTFHVNETWLRTGKGEMFLPINTESLLIEWIKSISSEKDTSFKKRFLTMLMDLDEYKWDLLEEMVEKTIGNFQNQNPPQKEITVSEAETAYIKSRSKNARNMALPASNITADTTNIKHDLNQALNQ